MQVVILAGGKGTRLKPYTTVFPKPLMPIGEFPILEIILRQLVYFGTDEVIMAVGHQKELIKAFFGNGKKWDLKIRYSYEDKPLGTAGPIKLVKNLKDNFLVMNGDILTDLNYQNFYNFHKGKNAVCSIAMCSKPVKIDLGVLKVNNKSVLTDYIEKPTLHYKVSMGIYAFDKKVLDYIPDNTTFDFPDLIKSLIANKKKVQGFDFNGYWLDIGRPDDYKIAVERFEQNETLFLK